MDSFSMVGAKGSYQFRINHLTTKDMAINEWITSPAFRVGSHDWAIIYYPQGFGDNGGKYVSVFLELQRITVDVTVAFELAMLDKHGNISEISSKQFSHTFTSREDWGWDTYLERTKLEETYLKDGYFVINVIVTVKEESYPEARQSTNPIGFPRERLQKFREENKRTDVTFDVDGKIFSAHRLVLAVHSPVFEAELFGLMAESNMECIPIHEMMPSVFKAMLDFMYSGSLSANMETIDGEELMPSTSFHQHLLAAADRYVVEKLKAIREHELIENISLDTVLTFLQLAEKHNCSELKTNCLEFIVAEDNLVSLLLTEEYIALVHNYPSLLSELKEMVGK